ncbi:MAG TPA: hypothetical protein VGR95_23135 [Thermoanaerobaculia bacterium]|jgi:hypothetical protein|nr:hypothetical protein [Thermoanaerobaculia bacterium]
MSGGMCAITSGYPTWITVSFDSSANFSGSSLSIIESGIDYWNNSLSAANLDGGIMEAGNGGSAPVNVTITVDPTLTDQDGALFEHDNNDPNNPNGKLSFNPDYFDDPTALQTFADHEMGHVLGFDDNYTSTCAEQTAMYGTIDPDNGPWVGTDITECDQAAEISDFSSSSTNGGDGTGPDGYCPYGPGGCTSPIVINLDRGPFRLSGVAVDPVWFDINADGRLDMMGWTARDSNEGFLALDRNGNGIIDNGTELFGNYAPLKNGQRAPNGFVALAEYDDNRDGVIDAKDQAWQRLWIWIDVNHDGTSQAEELHTLDDVGIASLGLDAHWTGRRDQSGNTFRYRALCIQGQTAKPYYDIYFVTR